jgi:hypothetical protein
MLASGRDHPGPERAERPEEGAPGVRGIGVKAPRHKRLHGMVQLLPDVEPSSVCSI